MNPHQVNIINIIQLIADIDAQKEYEIDVPIADVPSELVSQWFDDFYHPELRDYDSIFSDKEQNILRQFNDFYEQRLDIVPNTLGEMHNSFAWKEIVGKAQWVLGMLNWDGIEAKYDDI